MSKYIVVYKLGSSFSELTPREIVSCFELHAKDNNGKVLFTSRKFPKKAIRDNITGVILMSRDGNYSIKAVVDYTGVEPLMKPPVEYSMPSAFKNDGVVDKIGWFALSNVEKVVINKGDYVTTGGKDILDCLNKNAYMTYVEVNE